MSKRWFHLDDDREAGQRVKTGQRAGSLSTTQHP